MSNSVLVVGNGFDIAHGRKTRYTDFLEWVKNAMEDTKGKDFAIIKERVPQCTDSSLLYYLLHEYRYDKRLSSWIDLEKEIKKYVHILDACIDKYNYRTNRDIYLYIKDYSLSEELIIQCSKSLFVKKQSGLYYPMDHLITLSLGIEKERIFDILEVELEYLSQLLELYLIEIEPSLRNDISKLSVVSEIDPGYIISFNYTDTLEKLYGINRNQICYIHGSIIQNNIVLGYDDIDQETTDLIFKKYYRRLTCSTDIIERNRLREYDNFGMMRALDIYFFGHSLDVSDTDILKDLFDTSGNKYVYYYKDEDRATKIKNIISILGKDAAVEGLQSGTIKLLSTKDA